MMPSDNCHVFIESSIYIFASVVDFKYLTFLTNQLRKYMLFD